MAETLNFRQHGNPERVLPGRRANVIGARSPASAPNGSDGFANIEAMIADGALSEEDGRRRIAEQCGAPFVDITAYPPDRDLLHRKNISDYMRHRLMPWRRDGDRTVYATCDPVKGAAYLADQHPGVIDITPPAFVVTTRNDIRAAVSAAFGDYILTEATEALARDKPSFSAKRRLAGHQKAYAIIAAVALCLSVLLSPLSAGLAMNILLLCLFAPFVGFRLFALWRAYAPPIALSAKRRLNDEELPVYTIIAPLYKEGPVVRQLLDHFRTLNYPPEKIDIKLAVEADDAETLDALNTVDIAPNVHIVRVPPGFPRTKPKACNYALAFAEGDLVALYDAEDLPHPDQLRRAAEALTEAPPDIACLQARLCFYNQKQNWLTRQFAMEYGVHFGILAPGLQAADWPIPLGGTSNHFRTDALRRVGAWDAYNVTEDADLGYRFAAAGYRCRMLASFTREEATSTVQTWTAQRSRWIKGYLQTLMVHLRRPAKRLKLIGARRYAALLVFLGGSILTAFAYPVFTALFLGHLILSWPSSFNAAMTPLLFLNIAVLATGGAVAMISSALAARRAGFGSGARLAWLLITLPVYRMLMTAAGVLAIVDLIRQPAHWRKTEHGRSNQKTD
ncbi:MAG: glycosyltransferase family 2 protein [Pseudomonadota bacterium]